jgi:hypothetical protein
MATVFSAFDVCQTLACGKQESNYITIIKIITLSKVQKLKQAVVRVMKSSYERLIIDYYSDFTLYNHGILSI